ncbi:MAG: hypothetical protein ABI432_09660 [Flavobacteriales bacterium]
MPSPSHTEQREREAFVSAIERRAMPRFQRFRAWMGRGKPRGLEKPTRQEILLLTVPILLLPLVIPVCMFLFLIDTEVFASMPMWKRVVLLPLLSVSMPFLLITVLHNDVARPMIERVRMRRKALRDAGTALHEFTDTIPGIRFEMGDEAIPEKSGA